VFGAGLQVWAADDGADVAGGLGHRLVMARMAVMMARMVATPMMMMASVFTHRR
jgi:hypothetical protein